jgi:hypothetical protein
LVHGDWVQWYGRVCLSWCFLGNCKCDECWWVGGEELL